MLNARRDGVFVVAGDVMVDEYIVGTVRRVSPEAPIPTIENPATARRPGGAANVAMNVRGLGYECCVLGVVGNDEPGLWLRSELRSHGIDTSGLISDNSRPTTRKTRFGTEQQMILRVDDEKTHPAAESILRNWTSIVAHLPRMSGIVLSDYNKGSLAGSPDTNTFLKEVARRCGQSDFPVVADTKRRGGNLAAFAGFDMVKPNLAELEHAVGDPICTHKELLEAAGKYLSLCGAENVLVTLGRHGMLRVGRQEGCTEHVPTVASDVFDVTGAGDTVLAVMAVALAEGLSWSSAMRVANIAGAVVIGHRGTKFISRDELERKLEDVRAIQPEYLSVMSTGA